MRLFLRTSVGIAYGYVLNFGPLAEASKPYYQRYKIVKIVVIDGILACELFTSGA
jgi:hypothetical protein